MYTFELNGSGIRRPDENDYIVFWRFARAITRLDVTWDRSPITFQFPRFK